MAKKTFCEVLVGQRCCKSERKKDKKNKLQESVKNDKCHMTCKRVPPIVLVAKATTMYVRILSYCVYNHFRCQPILYSSIIARAIYYG